jgi:hypothetical protein
MADSTSESSGPTGTARPRAHWILTALGGFAALVLIVGLLVWVGTRDDGPETSDTTTPAVTTAAPTTTASTTTAATTTEPPTTTAAPTTTEPTTMSAPTTTAAPTTTTEPVPTTTVPERPTGDTWTVSSPFLADQPLEMTRVLQADGLAVYDGEVTVGTTLFRCAAVTFEGGDGWHESCGIGGVERRLVVVDGIDPWLVELGATPGTVTATRQEPSWTIPANGCGAPITTLAATADMAPAVIGAVVCVPGEAFVTFTPVWLQSGPPDGGGMLLVEGDEGWNSTGFGTSIGCNDLPDGVDRCDEFGVEDELFDAALPIPPAGLWTTDIIGVQDVTADARGWVGGETDPAAIADLVLARVGDPDAADEAPPTQQVVEMAALTLVVVEVRHLDDSIASTTHALWIDPTRSEHMIRATSWTTCARGVTSGLCV